MRTDQNRQIVLATSPDGELKPSNFRLVTAAMPEPGEGELLLETIFLSIDPYMRFWMRSEKSYNEPIRPGDLIVGATVSRVRRSRHPDWRDGEWVLAFSGWQHFAISNGKGLRRIDPAIAPPSTAVGVLGMTGFTAYAGLRNVGRPEPGETVVVAAASGAVGSVVGQIARIQGARAVGITTGARKLTYVKDELGFDAVVDYKAPDFAARLAEAVPNGIDVYFELVGGPIWDAVLPLLNTYARVPVVGLIADYEARSGERTGTDRLAHTMGQIMGKSLTLRGFIQTEFADEQLDDFLCEAGTWLAEGRLRHREHIVEGLENAPEALITQLKGGNFGKMLVKVGDDTAI
jgi:NADPH-dependent curcumin reductase